MPINETDLRILNQDFPDTFKTIPDYLSQNKTYQEQVLPPEIGEPVQEEEETKVALIEKAKKRILEAQQSISGIKKIIEQKYGEGLSVELTPEDNEVQVAMYNIFQVEDASEITFEQYKQALERFNNLSENFQQEAIDENFK